MPVPRLMAMTFFVLVFGCGKTHSKADVDRAQSALTSALEVWKNNEPPERLKGLPDPVEYSDELRRTHRLTDFALGKPNATDPELVRIPVKLKLQDRKGKVIDRDVVFEVKLASPVVIARDPYQ